MHLVAAPSCHCQVSLMLLFAHKLRTTPLAYDVCSDVLFQACIHTVEEALLACQAIGYPIMLKASWGGGGKGIRKVGVEAQGGCQLGCRPVAVEPAKVHRVTGLSATH